MATPVCVDTGAYYALADVQDPDHAEAVRLLQQIVRLRYALVTSNFVISEVYTLLRQRLGWCEDMSHSACRSTSLQSGMTACSARLAVSGLAAHENRTNDAGLDRFEDVFGPRAASTCEMPQVSTRQVASTLLPSTAASVQPSTGGAAQRMSHNFSGSWRAGYQRLTTRRLRRW